MPTTAFSCLKVNTGEHDIIILRINATDIMDIYELATLLSRLLALASEKSPVDRPAKERTVERSYRNSESRCNGAARYASGVKCR